MDWPKVELRQVMTLDLDSVRVDPAETYAMAGVYSFGKGLFRREPVSGANTSYKLFYRLKLDHVVMSQLFGWEGALALSSEEFAGMYVSPQFPTFLCNPTKLERNFLGWILRMPAFWEDLGTRTRGMGDRRRTLNPEALLSSAIPLPPLVEQRRVVSRIEELAIKVEEAKKERYKTEKQSEAILGAGLDQVVTQLSQEYENEMLIRLIEQDRGISYGVVLTGAPDESGIPTLRAGDLQKFRVILTKVKKIHPSVEAKYRRTRLRGNELLLRIRGGLGEVAVCPREMVGGNVSREIAVIPFTERVLPKFGMYVLAAPLNQLRMKSHLRGTSYVGINLKDVRTLRIPLPPVSEQKKVVAYFDRLQEKTHSLNRFQSETAAELDALMPSILAKAFRGEL